MRKRKASVCLYDAGAGAALVSQTDSCVLEVPISEPRVEAGQSEFKGNFRHSQIIAASPFK